MKTLDKDDIISRMQSSLGILNDRTLDNSGFIYPDGEITAIYCGTTHEDQCYVAETTLEEFLAVGGCRIKIDGELLCIEHNLNLTDKQKKCIMQIIRANKFFSLIYFQLNKKIDVDLNEWTGIKPYMLEKIWSE